MLSCTCDNASNNDTMTEEQQKHIPSYSAVNRTRCFLHICNLVAKRLLKPFDTKEEEDKTTGLSAEEKELLAMEKEAEEEELILEAERDDEGVDDALPEDDLDDWVDEAADLTDKERAELQESVKPVRRVLVKVRKERTLNTP
jgi:hypothetical protein